MTVSRLDETGCLPYSADVSNMIGHWIQPWPGESLLGEIIAVSGVAVVCRARNGLRFEVSMLDIHPSMIFSPGQKVAHLPARRNAQLRTTA